MHNSSNRSEVSHTKAFHHIAGHKQLDVWYAISIKDWIYSPLWHNTVVYNTAPNKEYPFFTLRIKNVKTKQSVKFSIDDTCITQISYLLEDEKLGSLAQQALSVQNALQYVDYPHSNYYVDGTDCNNEMNSSNLNIKELTVKDIESSSRYWQLLTFVSEPNSETGKPDSKMHLFYRWCGDDGKKAKKTWRIQIDQINKKRYSHLYYDMSTKDFVNMIYTIVLQRLGQESTDNL